MDIQDAIQQLKEYDLTEALENDEPHDIISEIADSNVDIYTSQLWEWASENYSYIEDAIDEFGFPEGSDGKPDMNKAIMQGQYKQNEEALWEAWEEVKKEFESKKYKYI